MASDTSLVFNLLANDRVSGALKSVGSKVTQASNAIGAAGAAALGAGMLESINVEATADKLAAQLGGGDLAAKAGAAAGTLYADAYGGSLEEVNVAIGAVVTSIDGMREASQEDLEAMTAKALDFATTFDTDVATAARVAGQAVTQGLAEDADHAMDLLFASMQRVPAGVREDLMTAMDEYAPFMTSLGVKGEEAMGLLVAATADGAFGLDKTGDALKEFTIRATDMSTTSKAGYDALGMSQEEMSAKFLAGGDTAAAAFEQVVSGLQGIQDPVAQSQAALALFGTPLEDLNMSELPQFLDSLNLTKNSLGDVGGAAEDTGAILNDNAATAITEFKRTVMAELGAIGNVVVQFGMRHQGAIRPALIVLAALAVVIVTVRAGMIAWKAATIAWTVAQKVATAGQWLWNAAMAANPVGLIIIAIIALVAAVVLLWRNNEQFRNFVTAAWGVIWDFLKAATSWIRTSVPVAFRMVLEAVRRFTPLGIIVSHWGQIWSKVKAVASWLRSAPAQAMRLVLEGFRRFTPLGLVISHWGQIRSAVSGAAERARSTAVGAFRRLRDGVVDRVASVVSTARSLPGQIVDAVSGLGTRLWNAGQEAVRMLGEGLWAMKSWLRSKAEDLLGPLAALLPSSPVQEGPLRILNNGYTGRQIVRMIAGGVDAEASSLTGALAAATSPMVAQRPVVASGGAGRGDGGETRLVIQSGGTRLDDVLVELIARAVRSRGGTAAVLGITRLS